jgi:hypothetical protein
MSKQTKYQMATLTALKLITAKQTTQLSPTHQRRNKLVKKLGEQIALATATMKGENYTQKRFRTVTNEHGDRVSVEVPKRVRAWWWQQENGKFALSIKYGSKTVPLSAKANAVECQSLQDVADALLLIKNAVLAGELDAQIEAASAKLREGFVK